MSSQFFEHEDPDVRARLGEIITVSFTKSNYSRRGAPVLLRRGERGSLVPLDADDLDLIQEAKSGAPARAAKTAERESQRLDADANAIFAYVTEHPECSVRTARAVTVNDGAARWLRAVERLGGALLANGRPMSELEPGKSAKLTINPNRGSTVAR
jgi:hypothetical protein